MLLVGLGFFFNYQNNTIEVSEFQVTSNRVGTLKIVQLSDLHGKQYGTLNENLQKQVEGLAPDLIVVSGDMVDDSGRNIEETIAFLDVLGQETPLVCVLGNHEWRLRERPEIWEALQERNIRVLENEILSLDVNGSEVHILGIDERLRKTTGVDVSPFFAELAQMPSLRIVLSHHPERYALAKDDSYNQYDFDLMFAGHAHGGQWDLPLIGGVVAPGQGLFPHYYRGMYDDRLIVSTGLGNGTLAPRLFNYPQIVVVKVN